MDGWLVCDSYFVSFFFLPPCFHILNVLCLRYTAYEIFGPNLSLLLVRIRTVMHDQKFRTKVANTLYVVINN